MKNIKIFLVPSSDAVMGDMTEVRDFFRQLNEMYFDSGINFSILNANEMTEDELEEHVADSDLSFFLSKTSVTICAAASIYSSSRSRIPISRRSLHTSSIPNLRTT